MDKEQRLKLSYMVATPDIISRDALGYHGNISSSARLLKDLGYDGIELTTANPDLFDWGLVRKAVSAAGLEVPLVCTGEVFGQSNLGLAAPYASVRTAAVTTIKRIVDFASEFGAIVNIGRSRWRYEDGVNHAQTEEWAYKGFCEVADYAAKKSVIIALEPIAKHVCNFINSTQDGLVWVDRVGRGNFKIMIDLYHMYKEDVSIVGSIEEAVKAGAVVHVHLCEENRKPPGYGSMDFAGAINALKHAGYNRYVSGEVSNYPDQDSALRRCAEVFLPLL